MAAPFQYANQPFWKRGPGATPFELYLNQKMLELLGDSHCGRLGHSVHAKASEMNVLLGKYAEWVLFQRDTGCKIEPPPTYTAWPGSGFLEINSGAGIGSENIVENRFYWNSGDGGNTGAVGLTHSQGNGKWLDAIMRNIYLGETWRWSSRAYRVCSNVTFQGLTLEGNEEEHGLYHNMAGVGTNPGSGRLAYPAVTYKNIRAIGVGAQIIQSVGACGRISETPDIAEDDTIGGEIVAQDIYAERCTNDGASGRASYSLSFFSSRNPVRVSNVFIDASYLNPSYGLLLVDGLSTLAYWQSLPPTQGILDIITSIQTRGAYDRSFNMDGGVFLTYRPNRELFLFSDMKTVNISNVHIDVDSGATQKKIKFVNHVGTISLSGMSQAGGVTVEVNGVNYGTLGSSFQWP